MKRTIFNPDGDSATFSGSYESMRDSEQVPAPPLPPVPPQIVIVRPRFDWVGWGIFTVLFAAAVAVVIGMLRDGHV